MHPAESHSPDVAATANDRFKQSWDAWLPRSIVAAVVFHVAVLSLAPDMTTPVEASSDAPMDMIIPADLELPPPPPPIERPAAPIVGDIDIGSDVTIPPTTGDAWAVQPLPPPARTETGERAQFERFVRSMVAPRLLNQEEVEQELRRTYPPMLREAGIEGDVEVTLWLDENGTIVRSEVSSGSGYRSLDEAALKVVDAMRLAPAQNQGRPVRVIVAIPVRFRVQIPLP